VNFGRLAGQGEGVAKTGPYVDWWHADPTNALVSEPLERLLVLWESKRRGGALPSRSDFTVEEFLGFGGRVALIDVEREPLRFRYRLVGTRIVEALGRDSTGRYFDELYAPDYYRHIEAHFSGIIEERAPLRTTGNMAHIYKPYVAVEGINIPLASDGGTVDMFIRALDFDYRGE